MSIIFMDNCNLEFYLFHVRLSNLLTEGEKLSVIILLIVDECGNYVMLNRERKRDILLMEKNK